MTRLRYVPRPLGSADGQPFGSAEEAWMWFGACQLARAVGARLQANQGDVSRPCDPDDIYRAVQRLYRLRRISGRHLRVLGRFAAIQCPPDPRAGDGAGQAILWVEALDHLDADLRRRGIVA
jgi:hypothetical protein